MKKKKKKKKKKKSMSFNICATRGDATASYHHPNIIHFVSLSENNQSRLFTFKQYLSVMSSRKFFNPEKMYLHANVRPHGEYWELAMEKLGITYRHVRRPPLVQGRKRLSFMQHEADFTKLNVMLKYGGIASDFDVIFLNGTKFREQQKRGACVFITEERCSQMNAGFYSCMKNSTLLRQWRNSYFNDYREKEWLYNAAYVPVNLIKAHQDHYSIVFDTDIAENPTWSTRGMWVSNSSTVNWRSKSAVHYFCRNILPSSIAMLSAPGPAGDMFRYVYKWSSSTPSPPTTKHLQR